MKEIYQLLVEYNAAANQSMMAVLDGLTPEQMSQDLGSFYKSIIGMLNHMLRSDIGYLR